MIPFGNLWSFSIEIKFLHSIGHRTRKSTPGQWIPPWFLIFILHYFQLPFWRDYLSLLQRALSLGTVKERTTAIDRERYTGKVHTSLHSVHIEHAHGKENADACSCILQSVKTRRIRSTFVVCVWQSQSSRGLTFIIVCNQDSIWHSQGWHRRIKAS